MSHRKWGFKGEKDKPPLHYTDCGLDGIYLVSGYEVEHTPYGEGITIKDQDQLHRAIGCFLVRQKKALSGKELRFLRKQMNLSQTDLGKLVQLTSQQVARWEKEHSDISGAADLLIRALFIEYVGGRLELKKLAATLDAMDEPATRKSYFENTGEEWKRAA